MGKKQKPTHRTYDWYSFSPEEYQQAVRYVQMDPKSKTESTSLPSKNKKSVDSFMHYREFTSVNLDPDYSLEKLILEALEQSNDFKKTKITLQKLLNSDLKRSLRSIQEVSERRFKLSTLQKNSLQRINSHNSDSSNQVNVESPNKIEGKIGFSDRKAEYIQIIENAQNKDEAIDKIKKCVREQQSNRIKYLLEDNNRNRMLHSATIDPTEFLIEAEGKQTDFFLHMSEIEKDPDKTLTKSAFRIELAQAMKILGFTDTVAGYCSEYLHQNAISQSLFNVSIPALFSETDKEFMVGKEKTKAATLDRPLNIVVESPRILIKKFENYTLITISHHASQWIDLKRGGNYQLPSQLEFLFKIKLDETPNQEASFFPVIDEENTIEFKPLSVTVQSTSVKVGKDLDQFLSEHLSHELVYKLIKNPKYTLNSIDTQARNGSIGKYSREALTLREYRTLSTDQLFLLAFFEKKHALAILNSQDVKRRLLSCPHASYKLKAIQSKHNLEIKNEIKSIKDELKKVANTENNEIAQATANIQTALKNREQYPLIIEEMLDLSEVEIKNFFKRDRHAKFLLTPHETAVLVAHFPSLAPILLFHSTGTSIAKAMNYLRMPAHSFTQEDLLLIVNSHPDFWDSPVSFGNKNWFARSWLGQLWLFRVFYTYSYRDALTNESLIKLISLFSLGRTKAMEIIFNDDRLTDRVFSANYLYYEASPSILAQIYALGSDHTQNLIQNNHLLRNKILTHDFSISKSQYTTQKLIYLKHQYTGFWSWVRSLFEDSDSERMLKFKSDILSILASLNNDNDFLEEMYKNKQLESFIFKSKVYETKDCEANTDQILRKAFIDGTNSDKKMIIKNDHFLQRLTKDGILDSTVINGLNEVGYFSKQEEETTKILTILRNLPSYNLNQLTLPLLKKLTIIESSNVHAALPENETLNGNREYQKNKARNAIVKLKRLFSALGEKKASITAKDISDILPGINESHPTLLKMLSGEGPEKFIDEYFKEGQNTEVSEKKDKPSHIENSNKFTTMPTNGLFLYNQKRQNMVDPQNNPTGGFEKPGPKIAVKN